MMLRPEIVVLSHHQTVASLQLGLSPQYLGTDTFIIYIGPLIGTTHHNGLVIAITLIAFLYSGNQLIARKYLYVGKTSYLDFRQREAIA